MNKQLPQSKSLLLSLIALLSSLSPVQAQIENKSLPYDTMTRYSGTGGKYFAHVTQDTNNSYIDVKGNLLFPLANNTKLKAIDKNVIITQKEDLYGIADTSGKVLVPFKYRYISQKSPHFFLGSFKQGDKDVEDVIVYHSGTFTVTSGCKRFDEVYDDEKGVCVYSFPNKHWYVFIDSDGNQGKTKYQEIKRVRDKKWFIVQSYEDKQYGIIDFSGKTIVPLEFSDIEVLSNDFIAYKNSRGYWGLLDPNGKHLVGAQYDAIYGVDFSKKVMKFVLDRREGLLDTSGVEIIPPRYNYIRMRDSGLIHCTTPDDKTSYFTTKLQPVTLPENVDSYKLIGDRILFETKDGEKQLIDLSGKSIIPPDYYYLSQLGDFFEAQKDNGDNWLLKGVLDKNGKIIVPVEYNQIKQAGDFFIAQKNGVGSRDIYTIYKKDGTVLFKPQAFEDVVFDESLNIFVLYDKKGKDPLSYVGHVDTSGNINRVNFWKYKEARIINKQLDQALRKRKKFGLFDRDGKQLLPFEYQELFTISGFSDKIFYGKDDLYGVMTRDGKIITKPSFEVIGKQLKYKDGEIEKDFPVFTVRYNQRWGLYNLATNDIVLPFDYDAIDVRVIKANDEYLIEVTQADKFGLVNMEGKTILPAIYNQYDWIFDGEMVVGYKNRQWQAAFDLSGKQRFVYSSPASTKTDNNASNKKD
ncbi:MAG: WG repeat-containing protein [Gammaproteobacteria bacterium]|nr:WG repeat-containing protein [Gammaproteobacteria bacterium]